jgi:predicted DsbA family dithiol-disulfide isomerase
VRLHRVAKEYEGRVRFRTRPFPLELIRGEAAPRDILEQEWWLAAIQEPGAAFAPYRGGDWPTTTLPAFEAAWCAAQQGSAPAAEYDLRVRRAFFAEGRNIGRPEVLFDLAREAGLDFTRFRVQWESGAAQAVVRTEAALGRERYGVRGTPTLTLADGTHLKLPIAFPRLENRRVVGISKLPCVGAGCDGAIRAFFERALDPRGAAGAPQASPGAQPPNGRGST